MSRLANGDAAHTNGHSAAKSTDQTHRVDYTVLYPFERTREEEDTLEGCCWFDIGELRRQIDAVVCAVSLYRVSI